MTSNDLAQAYIQKASVRLDMLTWLLGREAYSDVVREAQEAVELALKGMLRFAGIEPPKIHDVGALLVEHKDLFALSEQVLTQLASISRWLRHEREFAFYGDLDFIPTREYGREEAERAIADAGVVISAAVKTVAPG